MESILGCHTEVVGVDVSLPIKKPFTNPLIENALKHFYNYQKKIGERGFPCLCL